MPVVQLLIAAGGISALVASYRVFAERRKLDADTTASHATAAETLTGTAVSLITPLRAEIAAQTRALTAADDRVTQLRAELAEARARITDLTVALAEARADLTDRNRRDDPP